MGAFHVHTTAYAAAYRSSLSDTEITCEGNVRNPGNAWQCWAIVRDRQGTPIKPHQCPMRRRSGARKGDPSRYCCHGHRNREVDAKEADDGR